MYQLVAVTFMIWKIKKGRIFGKKTVLNASSLVLYVKR